MFDSSVFTQEELTAAIDCGSKSILLCDNEFTIPPVPDMKYTALGEVVVKADFDKEFADRYKIVFSGIIPTFSEKKLAEVLGSFGNMSETYIGVSVNGYGINLIGAAL